MHANPLLSDRRFPAFETIHAKHVLPAIDSALVDCRAALALCIQGDTPRSFAHCVTPLLEAEDRLARIWGIVSHLNAVVNTPLIRDAYQSALPLVTAYHTEVGQCKPLFEAVRAIAAEEAGLNAEQRALLGHQLQGFKLGGVELEGQARSRFAEIAEEVANLESNFENNVLDAINAWSLVLTRPAEWAGLPADTVAAARQPDGSVKLSLQTPCVISVLQTADDRSVRERLYRANATRASALLNPAFDNAPLAQQILALRKEEAALLGFAHFADLSTASKMARTGQAAIAFVEDFAKRAKPFAEQDIAELRAFAARELALPDLQAWDIEYVAEKLKEQRFAFTDDAVRQYFPQSRVLDGLFALVQRLFGVQVRAIEGALWHPSVRLFEVEDTKGATVGHFYLDPNARPNKQSGAWAHNGVDRSRAASGTQLPLVYLTCNFAAPVGDAPALLTHDDVITLFHEFGHGLHVLLTQVDQLGVSGWNHVEWDAVELPSQFMENFCWDYAVLVSMSQHAKTGEALPRILFDKMLAARNFRAGMWAVRQMEFSLFDLRAHTEYNASADHQAEQLLALAEKVRAEVAVVFPPSWSRAPLAFTHVFGGGYAAGYYSYKWAEVLSADAFAAFEESAADWPAIGARFRDEILARGGTRPAIDNFVAFRQRAPSMDALLRHNGLH